MLDPMDMTMDVYEVNDLKDWWETDLEVSDVLKSISVAFSFMTRICLESPSNLS